MVLPRPAPGQVIRYSYLWWDEHRTGREDGSKDRPCVIVLAVDSDSNGVDIVTVLPITHSPPSGSSEAMEIPHLTKMRLGLDDDRSWIMLNEANQFYWPGPDLRPITRSTSHSVLYGLLPQNLFELVRSKFVVALRAKRLSVVPRSE